MSRYESMNQIVGKSVISMFQDLELTDQDCPRCQEIRREKIFKLTRRKGYQHKLCGQCLTDMAELYRDHRGKLISGYSPKVEKWGVNSQIPDALYNPLPAEYGDEKSIGALIVRLFESKARHYNSMTLKTWVETLINHPYNIVEEAIQYAIREDSTALNIGKILKYITESSAYKI